MKIISSTIKYHINVVLISAHSCPSSQDPKIITASKTTKELKGTGQCLMEKTLIWELIVPVIWDIMNLMSVCGESDRNSVFK